MTAQHPLGFVDFLMFIPKCRYALKLKWIKRTEENDVVELIPALPENFGASGEVRNMVVNGAKISFQWQNGLVTEIHSDKPVTIINKHLNQSVITDDTVSVRGNS